MRELPSPGELGVFAGQEQFAFVYDPFMIKGASLGFDPLRLKTIGFLHLMHVSMV